MGKMLAAIMFTAQFAALLPWAPAPDPLAPPLARPVLGAVSRRAPETRHPVLGTCGPRPVCTFSGAAELLGASAKLAPQAPWWPVGRLAVWQDAKFNKNAAKWRTVEPMSGQANEAQR